VLHFVDQIDFAGSTYGFDPSEERDDFWRVSGANTIASVVASANSEGGDESPFRNIGETHQFAEYWHVQQSGSRRSAPVAKTKVLKKDLERIALKEIRGFPGGESVVSVEIKTLSDGPPGISWELYVSATKHADLEVLQEAARKTSYRLKRHYLLQPSP
jgi:hypothetical protein